MKSFAQCRWWWGALVAISCATSVRADGEGTKRFLFDGRRIVDPGLALAFTRSTPTVDAAGTVGPGAARYGAPALVCGAPLVETLPDTAGYGNINLMGAGVSSDNATAMLVILNSTLGRVRVMLGDAPAFEYDTTPNASKGGQIDFLRDSIDHSPDEAWSMKAVAVCHGVAVAMCSVAVRDQNGVFITNRMGFASCRAADLSLEREFWWRRVAVSDVLAPCTNAPRLGNTWSMQTWFAPGQEGQDPTRAWLAAADYRIDPCKNGGAYCVIPLTRPSSASDAWAVGSPCELPGRFVQTNLGTHAHAAGVARWGANGLVVLGARGDSLFNNANYSWTIGNENDYLAGASVPAGAFNYFTGATSWSGPLVIHGSVVEPTSPIEQRAMGNQWVSLVPGPTTGTFIAGADEVNQALWVTSSLTADPTRVEYTPVYAPAPTNWILPPGYTVWTVGRYLSFHTAPAEPRASGARYIAQVGPSNSAGEHRLNARLLYSPDGLNWGQFWAHRENEQANIALVNGRAYAGSIGLGTMQGIRHTPEPHWRLLRPLRVARGSMNYISADALTPRELPGSVTVAPSIGSPPCAGPRVRVVVETPVGAAPAQLATFAFAEGLPPDAGVVRLRLWVRGDTLDEGGRAGSLGFQFGLRRWNPLIGPETGVTSTLSSPVFIPGTGVWTPIVMSCDLGPWVQDFDPARLDLVVVPASGQWVNGSFGLAADSLSIGETVPAPVAPQATGEDESVTLTLASSVTDWTVLLAGMVPPDSWDPMFAMGWYPSPTLVELADETGAQRLQIGAGVTVNTLEVWLLRDGAYLPEHVSIPSIYWSTGSPVLLGLSFDSVTQRLTVRASVGGNVIGSGTIENAGPVPLSSLKLCPPREGYAVAAMDWFGGLIDPACRSAASIEASLRSLDFLLPETCPADYTHDGFVNGVDFDLFVEAFVLGSVDADFDANGWITGEDFDAFVYAFENGC